ncbi:MAG: plastocyanin, partial [Actinomycetota bacterium]|nr:plastocyanin [Actinomycetota bacterium]
MRRLAVPFFAALVLVGCDGAPTGTVEIVEGQMFDPETLTVEPGTTVTFVNGSSEAHTVTA